MKKLTIRIPDELHWQFKKVCLENKSNMNKIVGDFIKKFVVLIHKEIPKDNDE